MCGLNPFKKPKVQTPQYVAPQVVQPTLAAQATAPAQDADIAKAQKDEERRRKQQAGRAATLLTGSGTAGDDSGLATKKLLGG